MGTIKHCFSHIVIWANIAQKMFQDKPLLFFSEECMIKSILDYCRSPAQSSLAWARQGNRSGPPHPTTNSKLAKYKGIQGYSKNKSC